MRRFTQKLVVAAVAGSAMLATLGVYDAAAQIIGKVG